MCLYCDKVLQPAYGNGKDLLSANASLQTGSPMQQ